MSVQKLRKHQDDIPYTMASREVIQSLTNPVALAIWTYLQSLPENWNVNEGQIRSHFGIGADRYREAMRKLKEAGLYDVSSTRNDAGKFIGSTFNFYPVPQVGKPDLRVSRVQENHTSIKEKNNNKEKDSFKENDIGAEINCVALDEFVTNRNELKKPMTALAITKVKNILRKHNYEEQQYLVDQSIASGWMSVYPAQLEKRNDTSSKQRISGQLTGAAARSADHHNFLKEQYKLGQQEEDAQNVSGEVIQQISYSL